MRLQSLLVCIALLGALGLVQGQTCNLRGPQSDGPIPGIKCLDLNQINGQTINVPSNVTVIGDDGLSICPMESSTKRIPGVIVIMDQSSSMSVDRASATIGDPYGYRSKIARDALSYIYEASGAKDGVGWFAYIDFAEDIDLELEGSGVRSCESSDYPVNTNAAQLVSQDFMEFTNATMNLWLDSLRSPIQNLCHTGTNYHSPLERAKHFINNHDPGDVVIDYSVIFISDGRPHDVNKPFDVIKENYRPEPGKFPPIYGIFINEDPDAQGETLARLANETGGSSYGVNGQDTAALNTVMRNIVNTIIHRSNPTGLTIENGDKSYKASSVEKDALGGYQTNFNTPIPLEPGINNITFNVAYEDDEGITRNRVISFNVNVSGDVAPEGVIPTNNYFVVECAVFNTLSINKLVNPKLSPGSSFASTPIISPNNLRNLDILLTAATHRGDSSGTFQLISKRTGDFIEVQFPGNKSPGEYAGKVPVNVAPIDMIGNPIVSGINDSTLLVAAHDTILISWVNPNDKRDFMDAEVLIYQKPKVNFDGDTLGIDQIIVKIEDVGVTGQEAPFSILWGNGSPVGSNTALRNGATNLFTNISNMQEQLEQSLDPKLIVTYIDPLFNEFFSDTVTLQFRVPVMPRVWIEDTDGDGRADQLTMVYPDIIPKDQQFGTMQIVWGSNDEDTLFLRIDSINPGLTNFVTINKHNGLDQWIIDLRQPLPFGHTAGSGPNGEGSMKFSGRFDGRPTERILSIEDRVGPVILEMWVDPKDIDISYFRASEPLGASVSDDWFLVKRDDELESKRTNEKSKKNNNNIYTITLSSSVENRILSGDSVRFSPEAQGGVRDMNNNGAHEDNPYVRVGGFREPATKVDISISDPLIDLNKTKKLPPPADSLDIEKDFRVLIGSKDQGTFTDMHTNDEIKAKDLQGTMLINISVQLPMLNGVDSSGTPLEGFLIDGKMAWSTEIKVQTHFFDQMGQFISKKVATLIIDDPKQIGSEGITDFSLMWQPDKKKGLTTQHGRAVASGVIIAKITTTSISTALKDLTIYNEKGEVSKNSIKVDSQRKTKEIITKKIGYLRK